MSELRIELDRALARAQLTKPADCTCSGLHTERVETTLPIAAIIEAERSWGCCPAELRALERIASRVR